MDYDKLEADVLIAGGAITPAKRDFIRSIHVLNEFQKKGTIGKKRFHRAERKLFGQIGQLMEQFLLYLESLRRSKITINDHRLYLHRFLIFLESKHVDHIERIREEFILVFFLPLLIIMYVLLHRYECFSDTCMKINF